MADILAAILILAGLFFYLAGSIGLLRLPDLYSRLHALTKDARGFVFDGGYVFDSVLQTVAERRIPSVWVRRGLWQETQNNEVALDRQKIFDRIVDADAGRDIDRAAGAAVDDEAGLASRSSETWYAKLAARPTMPGWCGTE